MGHLQTCPLHLKSMPAPSLWHILHNEETRDNTFDYIFHSQLKKLLLNFSDYSIWNCFQLVVMHHVRLCIVVNHSLSLYHCREHKPTFQIINNWWLKNYCFSYFLKIQLELQTERSKNNTQLFSCPIITTNLFITTDFLQDSWKNVRFT